MYGCAAARRSPPSRRKAVRESNTGGRQQDGAVEGQRGKRRAARGERQQESGDRREREATAERSETAPAADWSRGWQPARLLRAGGGPHLIAGIEHDVAPHAVRHSDLGGRKHVAIHLRVPHRLLLAHRDRVGRRVRRDVHALVEEGIQVLVRERAHLLGVLEPERRDQPQVLLVEDVEAAHLREPRHEVLGDEAVGKARRGADEVRVLGGDDAPARGAERDRIERLAQHHVAVHHQHIVLGDVGGREPGVDRVGLVVRWIALLVDERVVAQVAVHKRRADLHILLRVSLQLRAGAREEPRHVAVVARVLVRPEQRDAVPVEEG
eukprot:2799163-Prymnesium_polylepis.2